MRAAVYCKSECAERARRRGLWRLQAAWDVNGGSRVDTSTAKRAENGAANAYRLKQVIVPMHCDSICIPSLPVYRHLFVGYHEGLIHSSLAELVQ